MNNKKMIIWTLAGALTLVILLLAVTGVWAEPNQTTLAAPSAPLAVFSNTISFQGRLLDSAGNPVNGTPVMNFRVYTQAVGGTPVWEDGYSVPVENGLFTVFLEIPPALFDGQALWLGVQVEGDAQEMTPRQQLLPAPYALYAKSAGSGAEAWLLGGNAGTTPGTDVLGTTDTASLTLVVNGVPALRLEPATVPNLIGGYRGNSVASGVQGATIGGGGQSGYPNMVTADYGTIGGGYANIVSDTRATIGGGGGNSASGELTTIGGGYWNTASGDYATVGGGVANAASDVYATIGGGAENNASSSIATIGGGWTNTADGVGATVAGGGYNTASGTYATLGGGYDNTIEGDYATVAGGSYITVTGDYATVPGGQYNVAEGGWSFAAGYNAQANHTGSFVWSDARSSTPFSSQHHYQFRARAFGGFRLEDGDGLWVEMAYLPTTPISTSTGAYLSGGGMWVNSSDRNLKENFEPVDGQDVLDRLAEMPISTWNYKAGDSNARHMGPVAQDFYATFGLGDDDRHIAAMDTSGVALAAIQELYAKNQALEAENADLQTQIDGLETRLTALEQGGTPQAISTLTTWWPLGGMVVLAGIVAAQRRQHRHEP
ncbi:MAG: tail fiber domain-containing protein [Anaerolineae bacterium]